MNNLLRFMMMGEPAGVLPPAGNFDTVGAAYTDSVWDIVRPSTRTEPHAVPTTAGLSNKTESFLGTNLPFPVEYNLMPMYTNIMRQSRPAIKAAAWETCPVDPITKWPTEDFKIILLISDTFQSNWLGTITGSFTGKAAISQAESDGATLGNFVNTYDAGTNKTTFSCVVTATTMKQISIRFTNTQRLPGDSNTGLTDVFIRRPGDTSAGTFTDEFIDALSGMGHIRFMDFMKTNGAADYGRSDDKYVTWATRPTRANTHSTWGADNTGLNDGPPIEDMIELCNATNCDMYVCIPTHCSEDYVLGMAALIKSTLNSGLKVWPEYSNERWNYAAGFDQYRWCGFKAVEEIEYCNASARVSIFGTVVPTDSNARDQLGWYWSSRQAKRVAEMFTSVFTGGDAARLRNVLGTRIASPEQDGFSAVTMQWLQDHFGFPGRYFYCGNGALYSNQNGTVSSDWYSQTHTQDEFVAALIAGQANNYGRIGAEAMQTVCARFGLNYVGYENGYDLANYGWPSSMHNLSSDPRIKDATKDFLSAVVDGGSQFATWYNFWLAGPGYAASFDVGNTYNSQSDYNALPIPTAFAELIAAGRPAVAARNTPTTDGSIFTLDARLCVGENYNKTVMPAPASLEVDSADAFPFLGGWGASQAYWNHTLTLRLSKCVAGNYELTYSVSSKTSYDQQNMNIGFSVNFGAESVGGAHFPDGHPHDTGPFTITLKDGYNWISIGNLGVWRDLTQLNYLKLKKI